MKNRVDGHCIYMKNERNLTYSKGEHVIPASLGGVAKLAKDVVSTEANERFSPWERRAVHQTLFYINRANCGPGKRGSDRISEITDPWVDLFEIADYEKSQVMLSGIPPVQLGFSFYGEICAINQIIFPVLPDGTVKVPIILLGTSDTNQLPNLDFQEALRKFVAQIGKSSKKPYIMISSELTRKNCYFILATYRKKWYISSPFSDDRTDVFLCLLQQKMLPQNIKVCEVPKVIYHYRRSLPLILDSSYSFLYAKTAFNVLAYLQGQKFALDDQFDSIRSAILHCSDCSNYFIQKDVPSWLTNWASCTVPREAHFIVIHGYGHIIEAYVSFYREKLCHSILLSSDYQGTEFRKYFFCDYLQPKAQREVYGEIP